MLLSSLRSVFCFAFTAANISEGKVEGLLYMDVQEPENLMFPPSLGTPLEVTQMTEVGPAFVYVRAVPFPHPSLFKKAFY